MNALRLTPILLAAVLCGAPAVAQSGSNAPERMRLQAYGTFISVNEMVATLAQYCPGDYGDAPYGAEGALVKLHGFVNMHEFATLADYIHSSEYAKEQHTIQDKVQYAFNSIRATQNEVEACRTLAKDILQSYSATKATLQELR